MRPNSRCSGVPRTSITTIFEGILKIQFVSFLWAFWAPLVSLGPSGLGWGMFVSKIYELVFHISCQEAGGSVEVAGFLWALSSLGSGMFVSWIKVSV